MSDASHPLPNLGIVLDIPVRLSAKLASCTKRAEEVAILESGAVVEFGNSRSGAVDLYANQKLIARGELVVVGKHLGVQIKSWVPAASPPARPAGAEPATGK